jgi:chromosome segregation ATPase
LKSYSRKTINKPDLEDIEELEKRLEEEQAKNKTLEEDLEKARKDLQESKVRSRKMLVGTPKSVHKLFRKGQRNREVT